MEQNKIKTGREKPDNSPHILNTSSNLLGLCFIVLTSLKFLNLSDTTVIDELTGVAIFMFMTSCLLSFISMRYNKKSSMLYEKIADFVFLAGLLFLFVTAMLITFNFIK